VKQCKFNPTTTALLTLIIMVGLFVSYYYITDPAENLRHGAEETTKAVGMGQRGRRPQGNWEQLPYTQDKR